MNHRTTGGQDEREVVHAPSAALDYFQRGWQPLPVPAGTKNPGFRDWQNFRTKTEEEVRSAFPRPDMNVGVLLGEPSGGLVDLDLDCDEALGIAGMLLPETGAVFGRSERPCSHWLYRSAGALTKKFKGPDGAMLVETRASQQTLFPPSTHPGGDQTAWERDGEPAEISRQDLEEAASRLAAACLFARNWPAKGSRQDAALALAGGLLRAGTPPEEVIRFIRAVATAGGDEEVELRCGVVEGTHRKVLEDEEVTGLPTLVGLIGDEVVALAMKWLGRGRGVTRKSPPLTDTGNAERLVAQYGRDFRYCHPWKKWRVWDGQRWAEDSRGRAMSRTKDVARRILREAAKVTDDRRRKEIVTWARTSEKVERRKAMLELAKSEPGIPVMPDELDRDPWLLNCQNGTLDLRTGELRSHSREDLITRLVPLEYATDAVCPIWERFIEEILPDQDVRLFMQRAAGLALTGDVSEQYLLMLYGGGANGKSTFIRLVLEALGHDYSIQAAPDLLMTSKLSSHPTAFTDLFRARLAVCTETGAGRSLDEVAVKQLTGGDRVRARRMREDFWEFDPTHKLWLVTNHRPVIRGTDHAIWRRILLVPFHVTIPPEAQDKRLVEKLRRELPGILDWCVRGCMAFRNEGLRPPPQVLGTTEGYRAEMDVLGEFLAECVVAKAGGWVGATELYERYKSWCASAGEGARQQRGFGAGMTDRGHVRSKRRGVQGYVDVALRGSIRESGDGGGPSGPDSGMDAFEPPRIAGNREQGLQAPPRSPRPTSRSPQGVGRA